MRGDWRARGVLWCTQAKGTGAAFKEKRGVWDWDPMLELTKTSPYLIVDSDVQPSTPTYKEKGWSGEGLSYWLGTFVYVW
jgi:hypothetical protein